ncbi:MAG: MASE1 domain-containing protein, partial [Elusimicrobia bacterium]|nr:MASE1 domain-containing protein [Elusimicrobiota bacterium]
LLAIEDELGPAALYGGREAFRSPPGLFRFAGAVAVATTVSAAVGTLTLRAAGLAGPGGLDRVWWTWWLGDTTGGWLVAPAIVLWAARPPRGRGWGGAVEAACVVLAMAAMVGLAFWQLSGAPVSFLAIPPLVWAALRLGPAHVVTLHLFGLAIMTLCTSLGRGPFAPLPPNEALLLLQGFGVIVGMTGLTLAVEVDRRRDAEEGLRRANAELEARVAERTEALGRTLEELAAAQTSQMREVMHRDFIASISHELRTPIAAILGFAETLRRGALEDARRRLPFVRTIERHAQRLANLVDRLLQLASADAGRLNAKPARVPLARFIDDCLRGLAPLARRKSLELSADIPSELEVFADPDQLTTIAQNLIENAIKYNRQGGAVRVSAEPAGARVRLRVLDTGVGIPAAELPMLFTRFHRGQAVRQVRGTGLGLSIVKALVEANGGRVGVESREGEGSTFSVTLPAQETVPVASTPQDLRTK